MQLVSVQWMSRELVDLVDRKACNFSSMIKISYELPSFTFHGENAVIVSHILHFTLSVNSWYLSYQHSIADLFFSCISDHNKLVESTTPLLTLNEIQIRHTMTKKETLLSNWYCIFKFQELDTKILLRCQNTSLITLWCRPLHCSAIEHHFHETLPHFETEIRQSQWMNKLSKNL